MFLERIIDKFLYVSLKLFQSSEKYFSAVYRSVNQTVIVVL